MFRQLIEAIRIEAVSKDERERRKVARGSRALGRDIIVRAGRRGRDRENPDRLARRQQSADYARELGRYPASTHVRDKHMFKVIDKARKAGRKPRLPDVGTGGPR